jgi:hypothetical protein
MTPRRLEAVATAERSVQVERPRWAVRPEVGGARTGEAREVSVRAERAARVEVLVPPAAGGALAVRGAAATGEFPPTRAEAVGLQAREALERMEGPRALRRGPRAELPARRRCRATTWASSASAPPPAAMEAMPGTASPRPPSESDGVHRRRAAVGERNGHAAITRFGGNLDFHACERRSHRGRIDGQLAFVGAAGDRRACQRRETSAAAIEVLPERKVILPMLAPEDPSYCLVKIDSTIWL